jgi:hypothetical protein
MELGYTLDMSHGATYTGQWAKGSAKRWWLSIFQPVIIANPKIEERIPIGTFRCRSCGYLESYAREEFHPQ